MMYALVCLINDMNCRSLILILAFCAVPSEHLSASEDEVLEEVQQDDMNQGTQENSGRQCFLITFTFHID